MKTKLLAWFVIIAVCGGLYAWQPELFNHAYGIIKHGDIGALAEYLRSFGPGAIVVTLVLFIVMTFTIVFPFMILSGAAGIVFGLWEGILLSWLGEILGALCMFLVARYFFRTLVEGWIVKSPYLKQVDDYSAHNGFKALLIARLLPLAPSGIITAVAAISRISFRDFFFATALGKLPPVVIKVLLGHDIVYAADNKLRLIAVGAVVILIYGGYWWWKRRQKD